MLYCKNLQRKYNWNVSNIVLVYVSTTGSVLTIKNIERENAGSYECVASNNLPPDVSREDTLQLRIPI
jgi:hypothetical protein